MIPVVMRGNLRVSAGSRAAAFLSLILLGALPAAAQEGGRQPRWYRSNAGGMALEETATRFAALGNEYALLVDYVGARELPPMLAPFYRDQYLIEVHVLYRQGEEQRRQWIFRDGRGIARLVSVLNQPPDEPPRPAETPPPAPAGGENGAGASLSTNEPTGRAPWGFIELYNENYHITGEHMFSDDGGENIIEYTYRGGLLIRAEGRRKTNIAGAVENTKTFTDNYRYNRSSSLRSVERLFHEEAEALPIRLAFPNRVLDAAREKDFIGERLVWNSEFFGDFAVKPGYRMIYTTDERGRVLTQSLLDEEDAEVWVIQNTWSANRIVSALKTEGENKQLIEYEYNGEGERIVERNWRNGVLERMLRAEGGGREVEELYMSGGTILRAVWEDGRKISEERIRQNR